jgi:hypothetical protein
MGDSVLSRVPVVAGLGYIERVRNLPSAFTATLSREATNRYFPWAIAVLVNGEKVGYVAPEIARRYVEPLAAVSTPPSCPGRKASHADHETSGVELLLDFTQLTVTPAD